MKVVNIPSTKVMKKLVRRVNTGTVLARTECRWMLALRTFHVIASEAKQSIAQHNG
jgi:hypothetical protein